MPTKVPTIDERVTPDQFDPTQLATDIDNTASEVRAIRQVQGAVGSLGSALNKLVADQVRQADDLATMKAHTALLNRSQDLRFNTETGAFSKSGDQVVGTNFVEDEIARLDVAGAEVREGLRSQNQRRVFDAMLATHRSEVRGQYSSYLFNETKRQLKETGDAEVNTLINEIGLVGNDHGLVSKKSKEMIGRVELNGLNNGDSPEEIFLEKSLKMSQSNMLWVAGVFDAGRHEEAADIANLLMGKPGGLLVKGNVDLEERKNFSVPVGGGGNASVFSMGIGTDDGKEILIPRVSSDGTRVMSEKEAIEEFKKTRKHLGVFKDADSATKYALQLSVEQGTKVPPLMAADRDRLKKMVTERTTLGRAQEEALRVFNVHPTNISAGERLIDKIKDPQIKQRARQIYITRANRTKNNNKDAIQRMFNQDANDIYEGKITRYEDISVKRTNNYSVPQKDSLKALIAKTSSGFAVVADEGTVQHLRNGFERIAAGDTSVSLDDFDPNDHITELDLPAYRSAMETYRGIKFADPKVVDPQKVSFRRSKMREFGLSVLDPSLVNTPVSKQTDEQKDVIREFERSIATQEAQDERKLGRDLTDTEYQELVDDIVTIRKVRRPLSLPEIFPFIRLFQGDTSQIGDREFMRSLGKVVFGERIPLFQIEFSDIPQDEVFRIRDILITEGARPGKISQSHVLDYYRQELIDEQRRLNALR